jgi:hypothetical protein
MIYKTKYHLIKIQYFLGASKYEKTIQNYLLENREILGGFDENGNSKIVEIDESLFKRKHNRNRVNTSTWVFGMIEQDTTKCVLFLLRLDRQQLFCH